MSLNEVNDAKILIFAHGRTAKPTEWVLNFVQAPRTKFAEQIENIFNFKTYCPITYIID